MKNYLLLAAFALVPLAPAHAQEATSKEVSAGESKPEKKICRTERMTGSLTRARRVCLTEREWHRMAEEVNRDVDNLSRDANRRHGDDMTAALP